MLETRDVENWDAEPGMAETWGVETRDFGDWGCWRLGYGEMRCRRPGIWDIQDGKARDVEQGAGAHGAVPSRRGTAAVRRCRGGPGGQTRGLLSFTTFYSS